MSVSIHTIAIVLACIAWGVHGRKSQNSIQHMHASAVRSRDNLQSVFGLLLALNPSSRSHIPGGARPFHKASQSQVRGRAPLMEDAAALQAQINALELELQIKSVQAQLATLQAQQAQPVAPPPQLVEQSSQVAMPSIASVPSGLSDLGNAAQAIRTSPAESSLSDSLNVGATAVMELNLQDALPVAFAVLVLIAVGLQQASLGDIAADEAMLPSSVELIRGVKKKQTTFIKGK